MELFNGTLHAFAGANPTQLYSDALQSVLRDGVECAPRGRRIKELQGQTVVQFLNPVDRVTFLRGRRINPFFQLAESLWILSGRSDVAFLKAFNANMASFSDDGQFFNASYGERIRYFTKNDLHRQVINPVDQLEDVYLKLKADPDTRQATIIISNPLFDNSNYTVKEKGKDIACNLAITFKARDGKLNMTVFNRSNDLHWGLFGANLCQFSTLQEAMATFLGLKVGIYTHTTDSLHMYLDDYGSKITDEVTVAEQKAFGEYPEWAPEHQYPDWKFDQQPYMAMPWEQFDQFLSYFWGSIEGNLLNDEMMANNPLGMYEVLTNQIHFMDALDPYWAMTLNAMQVYRLVKLNKWPEALKILSEGVPASTWKASMMYFLRPMLEKRAQNAADADEAKIYVECLDTYGLMAKELATHLQTNDPAEKDAFLEYLMAGEGQ